MKRVNRIAGRERSNMVASAACLLCVVALSGCHWDMWNQDRYAPLQKGDFFGEGESSSRMLIEGTVSYQGARTDTHYFAGMENGDYATTLPDQVVLTKALLERGQGRYEIFCTPCHGMQGNGDGMITQRGFPAPPSYHIDRLREVQIGYFFDVMTNGFGRMYSYATRVSVEDRWAIASYLRALQLSQHATLSHVPEEILEQARNVHPVNTEEENGSHGEH